MLTQAKVNKNTKKKEKSRTKQVKSSKEVLHYIFESGKARRESNKNYVGPRTKRCGHNVGYKCSCSPYEAPELTGMDVCASIKVTHGNKRKGLGRG